ncbi:uncharacterized protein LOC105697334 [Orussus abietinus]|uniref:uncharacterized protein LOC105697334 n=1 Tax=Orussus abietinus TaxID=222816 RepID=UPI00062671A4|nr:uncharacterized protein LOC105697334 [Orussus abietinus]XP_012275998.1 uncharacterized protein LOC105697334 [Orussus abietinus]
MSSLSTETLTPTVVEELTTSLIPTVTRVDARLEVSPVLVVLAVSVVFILSPITISGNSVILAAFYRYKRLRTASNCLLVSLAISDFGVGVYMPFGMHLELSGLPENGVSTLCIAPYCIAIALCSVSVLVSVAIAVDRLTSLAQPLRYKNIITHSSIEKYIAVFWIYAIAVGFSPLIYAQFMGITQPHSGSCRFGTAVSPPIRVFLVVAVWAPSALVLLGCYMYVYLVARAHARAIYTVELSFRHETQTLALPRYGQTLAVTVGAFLVLWLPFQTCMLLDIFCGTNILDEWTVVWLGLPILAHSGANPWIYAFHHGEMRIAAGKIAEDLVALLGVSPSRYGCSPARRASNTNLELAEVNNSNEDPNRRRDQCFLAKQRSSFYPGKRGGLELSSRYADISPEADLKRISSDSSQGDVVEEDLSDLKKMLDPKYLVDRNHLIDSNHNIDRIRSWKYSKYLNKIRHLRRLTGKNFPKFISYQNLKCDGASNKKLLHTNTRSEPTLNADIRVQETKKFNEVTCQGPEFSRMENSNLSSMSDPNIKLRTGSSPDSNRRDFLATYRTHDSHRYSEQNLNQCRQTEYHRNERKRHSNLYGRPRNRLFGSRDSKGHGLELRLTDAGRGSLPALEGSRFSSRSNSLQRSAVKQINITCNKLSRLYPQQQAIEPSIHLEPRVDPVAKLRKSSEILTHSESIDTFEPITRDKLLEPCRILDTLLVPTTHSEPPSPMGPIPLDSLREEDSISRNGEDPAKAINLLTEFADFESTRKSPKSPVRHSDPIIVPSVLLDMAEDCSSGQGITNGVFNGWSNDFFDITPCRESLAIDPEEVSRALVTGSEKCRLHEAFFAEHDSTRYNSRRPSDSRRSESSRSQEFLPSVQNDHQRFASSYSVNNFRDCASGSDMNDVTCLDPFMCPDTLTSSLGESFFEATSVPDSDAYASFDEFEEHAFSSQPKNRVPTPVRGSIHGVHSSVSIMNLERHRCRPEVVSREGQSRSTDSVFRLGPMNESCGIPMLEPPVNHCKPWVPPCKEYVLTESIRRNLRLAPLATATPTEICTPTFDIVSELKNDVGVGVRV